MNFIKLSPIATFKEFREKAMDIDEFCSFPKLRKYKVTSLTGDTMYFIRKMQLLLNIGQLISKQYIRPMKN